MVSLFDLWRNAYKNHEHDPIVWQNILTHIGRMSALMAYTDSSEQYNQFVYEILLPVLEVVGWQAKEAQGIATMLNFRSSILKLCVF